MKSVDYFDIRSCLFGIIHECNFVNAVIQMLLS